MKPTVAIAGATGFIGRWFIDAFKDKYHIVALSRRDMTSTASSVEWRQVELYSLSSTANALRGVDYAIYLVHSMTPSTRLNQSSFDNTDLLLADNFARGARDNQVKQILFLGGILPKDSKNWSRHLRSRFEVEQTLSSKGTPLTVLRAGIIVGPGGSSFRIIEKLVRRLPVMMCPQWTLSRNQPIGLEDTLKMIDYCLGRESCYNEAFEVGGPEITTYLQMMQTVAKLLGKRRLIFSVPYFSLGLSKLWVSVFTDSSTTLVSPLIESLRHELLVQPNELLSVFAKRERFESAAATALSEEKNIPSLPPERPQVEQFHNTVRSVQRLPNPDQRSAVWVARRYQTWLDRFFRFAIMVKQVDDITEFRIGPIKLLKLLFVKDRSDEDRQLFYIVGGWLAKRHDYGWLEFRNVLNGKYVIAAIHEFVPALPWYVYIPSQALIHLWVMRQFGKYLASR